MKKIPTLFERRYENGKVVDITNKITEGCEEAFLHGVATVKVDGACCAIIDGKLYKRYDAKNGKPIPEDAIKCQDEPDPITGHWPCWVPCNSDNPSDKWFIKAYDNLKERDDEIEKATGIRPLLPDGTYEAIGPHFQGNPYELYFDELYKHGSHRITYMARTYEGVKEWLETHIEEGIVFWLNGEPVCKIKRSDFGLPWPVKERRYTFTSK